MIAYRLVDEIAEALPRPIDAIDDEIDELDDRVEQRPADGHARRLRAASRLLRVRRRSRRRGTPSTGSSTDASSSRARRLFPHEVEIAFDDAYDKLLRAVDGLASSRDLLAGVRDYHQAKVANDQNEVMKRLTVIASLLLFPTFIVGALRPELPTTCRSSTGSSATCGRGA